jgi:uncharacterized protein (TIGR02117 family)
VTFDDMRKAARRILFLALAIVAAIFLGTFVPRPIWPRADTARTRDIIVLSNPIHTDIAIPLNDETRRRFSFLETVGLPLAHPDARWVIFGWGGRAFYLETPTWADLKPMPVFKALTVDSAVMRVGIVGEIASPDPSAVRLKVSDAGLDQLLTFVAESFVTDGNGSQKLIQHAGYGVNDRFFEAKGYFNALFGCNTWTARALREAGLRTGLWNPVPKTLLLSLDLYN